MKKGVKEKITISIDKEILRELDEFCSKTEPVKTKRSPLIEKAIEKFLEERS